MQLLNYTAGNWENNNIILHNNCARPNYNVYGITPEPEINNVYVYPNPTDKDHAWLHFEIMEEANIEADIYDMRGTLANKLIALQQFNTGSYDIPLPTSLLAESAYTIKLNISENLYKLKWILTKSK
jgi:hypothetical protein